MSFPIYGIIAIAAGGGTLLLAAAITAAIILHRRRNYRKRAALDNLRLTLQTGSNVDMHQVQPCSPKKKWPTIWASDSSRRQKVQKSPIQARTLRQASNRDSIRPLIKHKKSRDGPWKPNGSIVDTSDLEIIEPAPVYMPTGRPEKMLLTPISEKDTPESSQKAYRGGPRAPNGLAWNLGVQRPLPVPENQNPNTLSESVSVPTVLSQPMPKSILKKPSVLRSVSLQNQFPGPVPEQELPPTPKLSHAVLPQQAPVATSLASDYPYYGVPINHVPTGLSPSTLTKPQVLSLAARDQDHQMPTFKAPLFCGIGRKRTPPEREQYELRQLRTMDNSPAHSTKSSTRPPIQTHNSYEASVERFSLVRDKSSNLSLSLQDNWVTPSKPNMSDHQGRMDERMHDYDETMQQDASPLMLFDRYRRHILQESNGNSGRPSRSRHGSRSPRAKQNKRVGSQTGRQHDTPAPRTHSHKRAATHRIVIEPSRPNSMATSAIIPEDLEFDLSLQHQRQVSQVAFIPLHTTFQSGTRPPSVAIFDPAIEAVPPLYGLQQQELENDPDFQNPNPDYSPLMSIVNMSDGDYYADCSIGPLEPKPRDTLILSPPSRDSPLSSSPPESPIKIDESAFPRPRASKSSTGTSALRPALQANTSSLRKYPGRRRNQHRSPLRQSCRPSESPDPAPRTLSRESLLKQQARMTTTIMALRRQNSDVSQCNVPYFRLSAQGSNIGMDTLNKGYGVSDPFTDVQPAYLPGHEPRTDMEAELELERPRTDSERGLSPTAKKIMAEERREQYERRKSNGRLSPFGAIGEERQGRKARDIDEGSRQPRARKQRKILEGPAGLSPGQELTMAGAF